MAFPPAWTNYAGILSIPADFLIFSVFTAATISSRRIGLVSVSNQVPLGPNQSHSCKVLSSTRPPAVEIFMLLCETLP